MKEFMIWIIAFGLFSIGFGMYENLRFRLEKIMKHLGIKKGSIL